MQYVVHFMIWAIHINLLISMNQGNGEVIITARTEATSKSEINWDRAKPKIVSKHEAEFL